MRLTRWTSPALAAALVACTSGTPDASESQAPSPAPSEAPADAEAPTPPPAASAESPTATVVRPFAEADVLMQYTRRHPTGWTEVVQVGPDWTLRLGRGFQGMLQWRDLGPLDAAVRGRLEQGATDPSLTAIARRTGLSREQRTATTPEEHWLLQVDGDRRDLSRYGAKAPVHGTLASMAHLLTQTVATRAPAVLSVLQEPARRGWQAYACRVSQIADLRPLAMALTRPGTPTGVPRGQDPELVLHHIDLAGGQAWQLLNDRVVHIRPDGELEAWILDERQRQIVDTIYEKADLAALSKACP